ncbi:hypothetical protein OAF54_01775 [bacterium]|nr:hypothetical protein [bacterium]
MINTILRRVFVASWAVPLLWVVMGPPLYLLFPKAGIHKDLIDMTLLLWNGSDKTDLEY